MDENVEKARKALVYDLDSNSHVLSNPFGHGVTSKKIYLYLYACIIANVSKPDCVDWLYELYHEQTDEEKNKFKCVVDSMANALYGFYDYLNNTNK